MFSFIISPPPVVAISHTKKGVMQLLGVQLSYSTNDTKSVEKEAAIIFYDDRKQSNFDKDWHMCFINITLH